MQKKLLVACFVVFSSCIAFAAPMQDDPKAVFKKATDQYRGAHYDSCAITIRAFLKTHGNDSSSEYLVPLLIEAGVRQNDYSLSQRLFQIYLKKFPASPFVPRLWYIEGLSLVKGKSYREALGAFSHAITGGINQSLDSLTIANVQKISDKALTADEIDELTQRGDLHVAIVETMQYYELAKLANAGQAQRAKQKAEQFLKRYPRSPYTQMVKALNSKFVDTQKGVIQIGLLAPLSGYDAEIGRQVIQGIQIALDQYTTSTGVKLKAITCDTRGNMIETAKKTKELVDENHVPIIIGPMLSQNAVVAASMLMEKDVVMISPTATDDGISLLGPNIFQMNVTLGTLGAKIARYAIDNLNIHEFAIFSPSSDYAAAIARGFRQEVEKSGREVVDEETYETGTRDFKEQFDKLEDVLMQRKQKRTAVEKSLAGEAVPPPPGVKKPDLKPADTTYEVGGLFIPADAEDVVMIAPQTTFHRIKTQLLGSIGWHNPKTIADGKEYVANGLFSTNLPAIPTSETKEWADFKTVYKTKYGSEPDRIAALGYDAASLITQILREIGPNASVDQISKALSKVKAYKGASGSITMDPNLRTNTETSIMKIKDKQFMRVQ